MTSARRRKRPHNEGNWEDDFYRNGYPREVIVIEDSPTPPRSSGASTSDHRTSNLPPLQQQPVSTYTPPPSLSTRNAKRQRRQQAGPDHPLPPQQQSQQPPPSKRRKNNGASNLPDLYSGADRGSNGYGGGRGEMVYRQNGNNGNGGYYNEPPSNRELPPPSYDDKEGHYIVVSDDDLTPRYKITRLLGQGTFGKVCEVWDRVKRTYCAIKIIRAIQKYRDASKIEIRVLNTLREHDPLNMNKCIHLTDYFDYRNHICMVFELLGQSIFDFLKENDFCPFPPNQIQHFAKQLLTSVAFLHDLRLIHTDLKPENILLVNGAYRTLPSKVSKRNPGKQQRILLNTDIRLIDFGSATFEDDYHSSVVSTRHYRAPEIILGMGWSYPCDIWSVGCILVEFFTGDALFQTHDNLEHLAMMEVVLGRLPDRTIRQASRHSQKYFRGSRLDYPNDETNRTSRKYVKAMRPIREIVPPETPMHLQFLDLLQRLLVYDPAERITAREALRHPFFFIQVDEDGRELSR